MMATGTLEAIPNPIRLERGRSYAVTVLRWTAQHVTDVEIRIGGPDGRLLAAGGVSGTATTGEWVTDGMTFFLQDVSGGRPLTLANTLATTCVRINSSVDDRRESESWRSERQRLERLSRFVPTTTTLLGPPFEIVDALSFLAMYDEIVGQGIYGFPSANDQPYIIDGGANVGVSVYYFKQQYPDSCIVAFEPDPHLFATLARNAARLGWTNVTLVNKALARGESDVPFLSERSWAGRIARATDHPTGTVAAVSLRSYIDMAVGLLKLNIEGAETDVLLDCADLLDRVERIVVGFHSFVDEPQTLDRILALFAARGFRVYIRSVSAAWPLQPFEHRPSYCGMDMQLIVYAFRAAPS
jgi:FkbM family methyltransferase